MVGGGGFVVGVRRHGGRRFLAFAAALTALFLGVGGGAGRFFGCGYGLCARGGGCFGSGCGFFGCSGGCARGFFASEGFFLEATDEVLELVDFFVLHGEFVALVFDRGEEGIELVVVDFEGIEVVDARDEVAEDVHVVGKCVVGRGVDAAIAAVAVGFRGDEAQVVGGLEIVPVLAQALVATDAHAVGHGVEFVEGFLLHDVAQPGREVALFVDPRGGIFHGQRTYALQTVAEFGGGGEGDAVIAQLFGQRLEEIEDVARKGLEHTEGAELHEEANDGLVGGLFGDPAGVGLGIEGVFVPRAVVEAIADVFRQTGVAK